jgi:Fe-S cluster assembly protein SufD
VIQARTLIVMEQGSRATVIEDFVSLGDEACFVNGVTEVSVGANADVTHCFLERENAATINVATLAARHQRDSRFTSHSILAGGGLVRNNVNPILEGENITSTLNGIYVGRGAQHLDNNMRVEHRAANCGSRQYYKGILADDSHGVFTGRIIVSKGAQKTDAVQSNQNLLLSRSAQAQTRPQLEIYADDVKCTHGATIGELDEDAFFYLRARGLSETDARSMLVYAFASESLERIEHAGLRRAVTRLVLDRLPDESGALAGAIE